MVQPTMKGPINLLVLGKEGVGKTGKLNNLGRGQNKGPSPRTSGVLGSIPGLATYFRFSFRFFKKGSCQLLAKVCARSTG